MKKIIKILKSSYYFFVQNIFKNLKNCMNKNFMKNIYKKINNLNLNLKDVFIWLK